MKRIQILGPGCLKCTKLADLVQRAATDLGGEFQIEKVTDIQRIMEFGVMMTPALVVDGEVKVVGRVPTFPEIKRLIG